GPHLPHDARPRRQRHELGGLRRHAAARHGVGRDWQRDAEGAVEFPDGDERELSHRPRVDGPRLQEGPQRPRQVIRAYLYESSSAISVSWSLLENVQNGVVLLSRVMAVTKAAAPPSNVRMFGTFAELVGGAVTLVRWPDNSTMICAPA